jgi:hypothetical protein
MNIQQIAAAVWVLGSQGPCEGTTSRYYYYIYYY